jgi:hypothetical protein
MPSKKAAAAATAKTTTEIEIDPKQNQVRIWKQKKKWLNEIYSLEKTWWRKSTTDRSWTIKSKKGDK